MCGVVPIRVELRLPAPANLESDETDSYDLVYKLSWDAVTGASGYQLQERSDGGGTWGSIADVDGSVSYDKIHRRNAVGTYTYRVRACTLSDTDSLGPGDDIRCSAWSRIAADVTVHTLADSSALSSDETDDISNDGSYKISWESVTGAGSYVLEEIENNVVSESYVVDAADGTSQDVSGKVYGRSYTYKLKACGGADGGTACVQQGGAVTVQVKPAVPGSLSLASGTLSPVRDALYTLTWDTVDAGAEASYEIQERSEALGSPGFGDWSPVTQASIDTAAGSAVIDKSAAASAFQRNYEYQVRACASNAACGDWSGSLALSLQFAKPTLVLDGTPNINGSYTLTWSSIAGASQYALEERADGGVNWTAVNAISDPAGRRHEVEDKSQGDETEYRLRACHSSACGEWSDALEAEVPSLEGSLTLDRHQDSEQHNSYTISWSPVTADGVDRYRLKEWEEGQSEPADAACQDSSDLSCQDLMDTAILSQPYSGKEYQKSYHYEVRACAGANNCTAAASLTVNVRLAAPSLSSAGVGSPEADGNYTLSWGTTANADRYILEMRSRRTDAAAFGGWSEINSYAGADSYDSAAAAFSAHRPRAGSDHEYRLLACVRYSSVPGSGFDKTKDCRSSAALGVSVAFPSLAFDGEVGAFSTPGSPPNNLGNYTVDWGKAGDLSASLISVGYYELEESTGSAFAPDNTDPHKITGSSEYDVNNRQYGPAYYYRVRACVDYNGDSVSGADECGDWSSAFNVNALELSPSLLAQTSAGNGLSLAGDAYISAVTDYKLAWGNSVPNYNYLRYILDECSVSSCDVDDDALWTELYDGTERRDFAFSGDTAKQYGQSYHYRLRVCNKGADSVEDNADDKCGSYTQAKVTVGQPLSAGAAGLSSNEEPDQGISHDGEYFISWAPAERAVKYALIESVDGTETRYIVDAPARSYEFTADAGRRRVYGKTYTYSVAACLGDGSASDGSCVEQTGALSVEVKLAKPVLTAADKQSPEVDGDYSLSWNSVSGALSYILEVRSRRSGDDNYGHWSQIQEDAADLVYQSSDVFAYVPRADSDYEYRLSACMRPSTGSGFDFAAECVSSAVESISVSFPGLAFVDGVSVTKNAADKAEFGLGWGLSENAAAGVTGIISIEDYEVEECTRECNAPGAVWSSVHRALAGSLSFGAAGSNAKEYAAAYHYRVQACVDYDSNNVSDAGECGGWSSVLSINDTELSVELGASTANAGDITEGSSGEYTSAVDSYSLDWSIAGVDPAYSYLSFSLEECTADCGAEGAGWAVLSGAGNTFGFSGKSFNSSYNYRARVCNSASCSPYTQVRVSVGQPPDVPAGLRSNERPGQGISHDGEYVISWDPAERAVKYALIESVDGTETRYIVDAPALNYEFTVAEGRRRVHGKTYSYRVAACLGDAGESDGSCVEQTEPALTVEVKLADVSGLIACPSAGSSLVQCDYEGSLKSAGGSYNLRWGIMDLGGSLSPVPAADSYELEESVDGGVSWHPILQTEDASPLSESFSPSGPGNHDHVIGGIYKYRVKACIEMGPCSDWLYSPSGFVTVDLQKVGNVVVTNGDDGDGDYKLGWDPVEEASHYEIQEKIKGSRISLGDRIFRDLTSTSLGGVTTHPLVGKRGDGEYQYQIRACAGSYCERKSGLSPRLSWRWCLLLRLGLQAVRILPITEITASPGSP